VLKIQETRATSASNEINRALAESQVMVEGSQDLKLFEASEEIKKKPRTYTTPKEKWGKVYEEAAAGVKAHPGSPVGKSAQLVQASAALHLGKYDEAVTLYEAVVADPNFKGLEPSVTYGLGMAYWGKGDADKALATFDKLAQLDKTFAPLAGYQKGLVLEAAGKKAEAKEAFHELLEKHPDTSFKGDVERRLAML
jgi:tetratricopeptide (TPR) repeat protein